MKWKIFLLMVGLTLLLAIVNTLMFQIPLLIILTPLIIGTLIISISSMIQLGIVALVWLLFYLLVMGNGSKLI